MHVQYRAVITCRAYTGLLWVLLQLHYRTWDGSRNIVQQQMATDSQIKMRDCSRENNSIASSAYVIYLA